MAFRVERRFNLLILEEGEEYIADVAATMALLRKSQAAESKGRLRIGSRSLVFQPDEVSASILKFPFKYLKQVSGPEGERFTVECEQFVQVATKTGAETRIVVPYTIQKTKLNATFTLHYADVSYYLRIVQVLSEASSKGSRGSAAAIVQSILSEATASVAFDLGRLGHRERALLPTALWVHRVKPLLEVRGLLQLSNEAIYFQPHPNFSSKPVRRIPACDILHVFKRTYGVQARALEIITAQGYCLYLSFNGQAERDHVANVLQEQRGAASKVSPGSTLGTDAEQVFRDVRRQTALWQSGLMSNYHYLDFLNCAAGRSQNDFSQYPVFPWVLADYKSTVLRLEDSSVYRDLSRPIGALNPKRLAYLKERMATMPEEERFLYGTHYSTPAYVIYWLLRSMPERMLRLHNGHFDAWPRLFRTVRESWESVNESTASLMELIPEFFTLPADWLENSLGILTAEGPLIDVVLPPWASSVIDFVCKMRAALESSFVSRHLPAWIDLIFGYKQLGEEALKADNLFHPVCYTGATVSAQTAADAAGMPLSVLETQLQEFGRVPKQLFTEPHPPRLKIPTWDVEKLKEDPALSEPWYKALLRISAAPAANLEALPANFAPFARTARPAAPSSSSAGRRFASAVGLKALTPKRVAPITATGLITGVVSCPTSLYYISEDGCLRVGPALQGETEQAERPQTPQMRRSFRISPMPLSALALIKSDLLVIGGHDNAVTLYSSSSGSVLAKQSVHADTVTCLAVSPCGNVIVSGSRDQSVRVWTCAGSTLKGEAAFDDMQQTLTCVSVAGDLVVGGAFDGQLMVWDRRSGQVVLDRPIEKPLVACDLRLPGGPSPLAGTSAATSIAGSAPAVACLDESGQMRIWDLRKGCESVRLSIMSLGTEEASSSGRTLTAVHSFMSDFSQWALFGGCISSGIKSEPDTPVVCLWDIPEQKQVCQWALDPEPGAKPTMSSGTEDERFHGGPAVRYMIPFCGTEASEGGPVLLAANALGAVYSFR